MNIRKYKLKNGLTIVHIPTNTNSVTIQALVNVGSINENEQNNGISHFIEHMLFEGTKKFKTNRELTNEIEKLGGSINAYTSKERTCYHIKILNKYFDKALDVILDIIQNPLFREADIEREKKIISKEIDLVLDEPRFYQWILLNKLLYDKTAIAIPVYGSKKVVEALTRKEILDYYSKYYVPNNIILTVIGNSSNLKEKVEAKFDKEQSKTPKIELNERELTEIKVKKEKRKIASSYFTLGFKAPKRTEKESDVFEVIEAILGKGMSGRLFDEIRNKRGLAYEVGAAYFCERDFGYFAIYANTEKKNINKIKEIVLSEIQKLNNINEKELEESKNYIEGNFYLTIEDTENFADIASVWEQASKVEELSEYIKNIRRVTIKDIQLAIKKYFSKPYALAIIEGEN